MGMLLVKRGISYEDRKMTFDTLFSALLIVGHLSNKEEVSEIPTEMQSGDSMSDSGFLNQFLNVMNRDLRRSTRSYSYDYDYDRPNLNYAAQYAQ